MILSGEAIEMIFSNIFFFPGAPSIFNEAHLFIEHMLFFQKGDLSVHLKDVIFPDLVCGSNTCHFPGSPVYSLKHIILFQEVLLLHRTHMNFSGASILSSNRYQFFRKPYLVLEHIRFSRRPYALCH